MHEAGMDEHEEWVRLTGYDPIDGVQLRWDHRGYYFQTTTKGDREMP